MHAKIKYVYDMSDEQSNGIDQGNEQESKTQNNCLFFYRNLFGCFLSCLIFGNWRLVRKRSLKAI